MNIVKYLTKDRDEKQEVVNKGLGKYVMDSIDEHYRFEIMRIKTSQEMSLFTMCLMVILIVFIIYVGFSRQSYGMISSIMPLIFSFGLMIFNLKKLKQQKIKLKLDVAQEKEKVEKDIHSGRYDPRELLMIHRYL